MPHEAGFQRRRSVLAGFMAVLIALGMSIPASATDLTGTWSGHWRSRSNNHTGPMKARFTRINASQYEVRFSGRFCTIIPFCYTETLHILCDDGQTVELCASRNLGCLFGTFHMRAAANCCYFNANYSAEKDQGYFALSRTGY